MLQGGEKGSPADREAWVRAADGVLALGAARGHVHALEEPWNDVGARDFYAVGPDLVLVQVTVIDRIRVGLRVVDRRRAVALRRARERAVVPDAHFPVVRDVAIALAAAGVRRVQPFDLVLVLVHVAVHLLRLAAQEPWI